MNAQFKPIIDDVSVHYHPSPDHDAHYDRHKYPLSNKLTMLRAVVREQSSNKWFGHSRYTQQNADNCWWTPLPASPTYRWTWEQPTFKWFLITPIVDPNEIERIYGRRGYENSNEILYKEEVLEWSGWGPTKEFEPGTRRYRVEVTYNGRTVSSPGAGNRTSEGYIPASEARKARRMSVRDAQYSNPIAQWATAWLNVPFIYGSTPSDVENFEGVDCADLLIAAHNKAHTWHSFDYTYANDIAKNENMTEPGQEGVQGDLIFWDYHGPNEQGEPDGVYDHSMICLGGNMAIWASAGWDPESPPDLPRFTKRCVVIGDYEKWRLMIYYTRGIMPQPYWRRFR